MILLPKKIGPLTLQRKLGTGGLSETYLGQTEDGTRVLVRRVLPFVRKDGRRLASVEARVRDLLGIRHPFLVQVLDWVEAEDERFVVEQWVEGIDLERVITWCRQHDKPIPHNVFLNIATQVCSALEVLHGRPGKGSGAENVLHLGLQPGHIFVTGESKVQVGGYALVRSPTALPQGGIAGPVPTRMEYLSPEQTHPDQKLAPASDVFALGALLYELLTLEPLFRADSNLQTIHRIRGAEVQTQLQRVKQYMPGLDKVLFRALSLNPRHRYQRAFVLREDLRGLMSGYSFANIADETHEFLAPIEAETTGSLRRSAPTPAAPATQPEDTAAFVAAAGATLFAEEIAADREALIEREQAAVEAAVEHDTGQDPEEWVEPPTDLHMPDAPPPPAPPVVVPEPRVAPPPLAPEHPLDRPMQPQAGADTAAFLAADLHEASFSDEDNTATEGLEGPPPPGASPTLLPEEEFDGPGEMPRDPDGPTFADPDGDSLDSPTHVGPDPSLDPLEGGRPTIPTGKADTAMHVFEPAPPAPPPTPELPVAGTGEEEITAAGAEPPPVNVPLVAKPAAAPPPAPPKPPAQPKLAGLHDAPPPVPRPTGSGDAPNYEDEPTPSSSKMPLMLGVAAVLLIGCAGVLGGGYWWASNQLEEGLDELAALEGLEIEGVEPTVEAAAIEDDPTEDAIAALSEEIEDEPEVDDEPEAEPPAPEPEVVSAAPPSRLGSDRPSSSSSTSRPRASSSSSSGATPKSSSSSSTSSSSSSPKSTSSAPAYESKGSLFDDDEDLFSSDDALVDVALDDPTADTGGDAVTDLDEYSDAARRGRLTSSEVMVLEMVELDDVAYTRSRSLLLMNAEQKDDSRAVKRYLDQLMVLPENTYDSVLLSKEATYYINKKSYQTALDKANRAERYWARIPSALVFDTKADIYECQAAAWQGLFYEDGEDLELLDNAIEGWEKYRRHVMTKNRTEAARQADSQIAKLEDVRQRLE